MLRASRAHHRDRARPGGRSGLPVSSNQFPTASSRSCRSTTPSWSISSSTCGPMRSPPGRPTARPPSSRTRSWSAHTRPVGHAGSRTARPARLGARCFDTATPIVERTLRGGAGRGGRGADRGRGSHIRRAACVRPVPSARPSRQPRDVRGLLLLQQCRDRRRAPGAGAAPTGWRSSTSTTTTATGRSSSSGSAATCCMSHCTRTPHVRSRTSPGTRMRPARRPAPARPATSRCRPERPSPSTSRRSRRPASCIDRFEPDGPLIVSLGFDTFERDPIGDLALRTDDYAALGSRIAALARPMVILQEGGYAVDAIGANADLVPRRPARVTPTRFLGAATRSPQPAARISASIDGSALPPEMTMTRALSPASCGDATREMGGHGRRTRRLRHQASSQRQRAHRRADLVVRDGHDLVDVAVRIWAHGRAPMALTRRPSAIVSPVCSDAPARRSRRRGASRAHRPRASGSTPDDADARHERLEGGRDAADQPAAADRHEHAGHRRQILGDLQAARSPGRR